jgi:hypothetical protein
LPCRRRKHWPTKRDFALEQEMDRRELLGLGVAAATFVSTHSADGQTSQAPEKPVARHLKATITIGGKAFTYSMDGGKDLGNFSGPDFVQQNVRGAHPSPEFSPAFEVYFRPDLAPSTRIEIVFEFFKSGDLAGAVATNPNATVLPAGVTAANIMSPVTIEVFDERANPVADYLGRTLITAPKFFWGSRFRFKTKLRPIVRTPGQLAAARLILPFGTKGLPGRFQSRDFSPITYTNPMDLAGVNAYGPSTGERDDIGLVTEEGGNYLVNPGDPVAQNAMLAMGEASATWPMHFRDDATGAPINKLTYPRCNNYGWPGPSAHYQGEPDIWTGAGILNTTGQPESGIIPDVSHFDSLSYMPFLITGDAFHLEEQQFAATYALISNNNGFNGNAVVGTSGGTRAMAWALRAIFEAWVATKQAEANGPLPEWLMPSSYFDAILKNHIPFLNQWVKSRSIACTLYHCIPDLKGAPAWVGKYMAVVLLFGVLLGRSDFKEACEWMVQESIDKVNGRTGAPPAFPDPYYFIIGPTLQHLDPAQYPGPTYPDSLYFPDLGTAFVGWAQNDMASKGGQITASQLAALQADPLNGGVLIQTQDDYVNYVRGVCAAATYLNALGLILMPDAPACLDRMNKYVQGLHGGRGYAVARWAFLPSVDGSLPAFTPLPKPIPLPSAVHP